MRMSSLPFTKENPVCDAQICYVDLPSWKIEIQISSDVVLPCLNHENGDFFLFWEKFHAPFKRYFSHPLCLRHVFFFVRIIPGLGGPRSKYSLKGVEEKSFFVFKRYISCIDLLKDWRKRAFVFYEVQKLHWLVKWLLSSLCQQFQFSLEHTYIHQLTSLHPDGRCKQIYSK